MDFELSDYIDMDLTNFNAGHVFGVEKLNRTKIITHAFGLVGLFQPMLLSNCNCNRGQKYNFKTAHLGLS